MGNISKLENEDITPDVKSNNKPSVISMLRTRVKNRVTLWNSCKFKEWNSVSSHGVSIRTLVREVHGSNVGFQGQHLRSSNWIY